MFCFFTYRYKVNVEPGVHSVHSLHKILTNVGFDFDKLPRRMQTPPHNLNNYSLQMPRHRSHHSEMHVSSNGLPRGGTPSTGSMPPINESDIYSDPAANVDQYGDGEGGQVNGADPNRVNDGCDAARSNKYGQRIGGAAGSTGSNFNAGVRRHRNHVSYATTGLSDGPLLRVDSADGNVISANGAAGGDANARAPQTPAHAAAIGRAHRRRRSSQPGRPSITSVGSRLNYAAVNSQSVSRQPGTPNTLTPPQQQLGVAPKVRATPSQTSTGSSTGRNAPNIARPMYRDDIFYTGSIVNLPEYKQARNVSNYLASTTHIPDEEIMNAAALADGEVVDDADGENPPPYDNNMAASFISSRRGSSRVTVPQPPGLLARLLPSSARATLKNMLGTELLRNGFFSLYCLANLICMIAFYIPYVYLPDMAILMSGSTLR